MILPRIFHCIMRLEKIILKRSSNCWCRTRWLRIHSMRPVRRPCIWRPIGDIPRQSPCWSKWVQTCRPPIMMELVSCKRPLLEAMSSVVDCCANGVPIPINRIGMEIRYAIVPRTIGRYKNNWPDISYYYNNSHRILLRDLFQRRKNCKNWVECPWWEAKENENNAPPLSKKDLNAFD